ncbi:MAG: class I SAM-dependent methyltransferase [Acidimicrobiia bacterium]
MSSWWKKPQSPSSWAGAGMGGVRFGPFGRQDATDDRLFYALERKVTHLEEGAIGVLRAHYARVLRPGCTVLDLMSSWRSHLPDGLERVAGLGMNAAEMADNPQLGEFVVHDLNASPTLPYGESEFDAAVCTVSVQYLIRPVEVFAEVRRVVRPGGPLVVAFSNRCFPTKAIAAWLSSDAQGRLNLVCGYLEAAAFDRVEGRCLDSPDDPLWVVEGWCLEVRS